MRIHATALIIIGTRAIEVCRMLINCGAHNHPIDRNGTRYTLSNCLEGTKGGPEEWGS